MGSVIEFPAPRHIWCCRKCRSNTFFVWLNSSDPNDFDRFECADCGNETYVEKSDAATR